MAVIQFSFIILIPLVIVAGAVLSLFLVGATFDALEHPNELRARVEGAFRQPPRAPRQTAVDHYYRPHWGEGHR